MLIYVLLGHLLDAVVIALVVVNAMVDDPASTRLCRCTTTSPASSLRSARAHRPRQHQQEHPLDLATNGGEALVIVVALLFGLTLPITAVQILRINMVTAVTLGLTFAFEPAEADVIRSPPRSPDQALLSRFVLWRVVLVSVLCALGAFGIFWWADSRSMELDYARTLVVNTIVVLEIFYLFSSRFPTCSSFGRACWARRRCWSRWR